MQNGTVILYGATAKIFFYVCLAPNAVNLVILGYVVSVYSIDDFGSMLLYSVQVAKKNNLTQPWIFAINN